MKRRIPFDISLRPQIEAGEYLIEDKFGNLLTFKCVKDGLTYFTKRQEGANYDTEVIFDYPQRHLFLIENKEEDDFDRLLKEMIEDVINGDYTVDSFDFWKNKLIESLSNQQSVIFKEEQIGRWIVNDDKRIAIPTQILGIEKYGFMTSRGYLSFAKVNKEFHVWTMKDAKAGDVLQLGNVTAIFKSTVADSANDCYCYCSIYANEFQIPAETEEYGCYNAKPATKEQKEALLSKMKDEGYSFDFNTNVLTKVKETEPKFKVGDWCIDNEDGTIFQIVKVLDNTYTYKTNKGEEYSCAHYSLEVDARLWTIQDAKPGDVLVDNLPFIFKKIDHLQRSYAYCGMSIYGFKIESEGESGEWTWMKDIKPATKEQYDLLFQKMEEAGYKWDEEKKELKKIKQEPTWNEKIKGLNELETYILSLVPDRSLDAIKVDAKNIRYIINKEQKSAVWNEKDDKTIQKIIEIISQSPLISSYKEMYISWLKSLNPQPKQEWSEEDEKLYISALWHIKNSCGNSGNDSGEYEVYNWLQSLKDRVQPKPKIEWSKEEEERLITDYLKFKGYEDNSIWFKSLKDSVQPNQKWSKEDEENRINAIKYLEIFDAQAIHGDVAIPCINWLKSLKFKPKHWKPNNEQLNAFELFVKGVCDSGYASPYNNNTKLLYSLLNDLKKL